MTLTQPKRSAATTLKVFRYKPLDSTPVHFDSFEIDTSRCGPMVLDALIQVKDERDHTLAFRRSCREGICGSCAMNIDGKNGLACVTPLAKDREMVVRPLPQTFVLRDLVPDLTNFYQQYQAVQPWLQNEENDRAMAGDTSKLTEQTQTIAERKRLDGQYECILCACCTTACPSQWWNPETFLGPQALLAAHRWVSDSRDDQANDRLADINDTMKLYRCHNIKNCTDACPKGLKPAQAIENLKKMIETNLPTSD